MLNLKNLTEGRIVEMPGQYEIEITVAGDPPTCGCASPNIRKNGRRRSMFFDTPMHGKKVGIIVQQQRFQCIGCKRTYYEKVPHMHLKHDMSERLVEYIQTNCTERTFTAVALEIGVDVQTVRGIWRAHAEKELNRLCPVTPVSQLQGGPAGHGHAGAEVRPDEKGHGLERGGDQPAPGRGIINPAQVAGFAASKELNQPFIHNTRFFVRRSAIARAHAIISFDSWSSILHATSIPGAITRTHASGGLAKQLPTSPTVSP